MKKFILVALAAILVFAMAACADSGTSGDTSAEPSTEATEEATAEATEAAATDDAAAEATDDTAAEASDDAEASQDTATGQEITDDQIKGETVTVGIINNPPSESGYREANVKDFESVFTAENGFDTKTTYSLKNDEQLNAAQQFITDGVDYLLISAAETTGWDSVLQSAQEAGIKVYLFDRMIDVNDDLYEAAVVSDMQNEGQLAVNWLLKQPAEDTHKVVHIQGVMGSDAQIGRTEPLQEQADTGTLTIVAQQTASWDEAEAKKIVESVINSGDSFDVIYAENDGMARGAVAALDEAGISHGVDGDVIVMGFDCNKWALEEVLAGRWNYDGQCSPFQARPIAKMIRDAEKGENPASKIIISDEKGFAAGEITEADVEEYGIG